MNVEFEDEALVELYKTGITKDSRYKKLCRDVRFIERFRVVVDMLLGFANTSQLSTVSYLHYEKLKHRPESSVRITEWTSGEASVYRA